MTTLQVQLPESLLQALRELAQREKLSLDELAVEALQDKVAALTTEAYFRQRAARGDRRKFLEVLAKVPDVPPMLPDTPAR